jgi:hypothetical protein
MKSGNEPIEEFLQGVVLPEYKSDAHERQLRAQILSRLQASRGGRGIGPSWKTIALLLGLLGAGALAAEIVIQVHHYYFEGKIRDGTYLFSSPPEEGGTNQMPFDSVMISGAGNLDAAAIEKKRKDLEEIGVLRQRNARELVSVIDSVVNSNPQARTFCYKYVLADGRTETVGECGDESESDREQIAGLRQRGERELVNIVEVESGGFRERTLTWRYVLGDGRAVSRAEKDTEVPGPAPLTSKQQNELWQLMWLEKGKFLGSAQVQVLGKTVSLRKYAFTLSDGTVVTRSEGLKIHLTAADGDEWQRLIAAKKGETLGTYEEVVKGQPFKFARMKYVLRDGTEIIQSVGKPDVGR